MKKSKNEELGKKNILKIGKEHIRVQVVIFLLVVLFFYLVSVGIKAVFFGLITNGNPGGFGNIAPEQRKRSFVSDK